MGRQMHEGRCSMRHISRAKGFTLIELIVITPMIILLIGALVAITIQASTSALRANARAQLQHEVLSALDMIEQDARLSISISAQYASQGRLDMDNFATDISPLDTNRKLIRRSTCTAVTGSINPDEAVRYWRNYSITNRQLQRWANFSGKWCDAGSAATMNAVWQTTATEVLIGNADLTMTAVHDIVPGTTNDSTGIQITLTAKRTVGGQEISYTGSLYVVSSNAISLD